MEKKEEKERGFVCTRRTESMKYARDRFIEGKFGRSSGTVGVNSTGHVEFMERSGCS